MGQYLKTFDSFLRCLTLCHDCSIIEVKKANGKSDRVLTGASLDEQCLLNQTSKDKVGRFLERSAKTI